MGVGASIWAVIKGILLTIWDFLVVKLIPVLWDRFWFIISAPFTITDMLWIVSPLFIALCLMEFYFGRYSKEELGWNTAVGNSLILIFVSLDLLRFLFGSLRESAIIYMLYRELKVIIALFIGLQGIVLLYENFFHKLPKKISFYISSAMPINITAYLAVVITYTNIPVDIYTIIAALLLFVLFHVVFRLLDRWQAFIRAESAKRKKKPEPVSIHYNIKAKAPKGMQY